MDRWSGRLAVVTGASVGIGADIAVELANHGMVVVAAARRLDKLQDLQKRVRGQGRILPILCDVSKEADIRQLIEFAKKNGGVDVLVNNAAYLSSGSIVDFNDSAISLQDIEASYKINVIGTILATRLAVADMIARKCKGHIINLNSIAGHKVINMGAMNMSGVYGSTKFAITQLTEQIRYDMAHTNTPVRVTSISPGAVDTAMLASIKNLTNAIPMVKGEDIAQAVVYVLSVPDHVNITELTIQPVGEKF